MMVLRFTNTLTRKKEDFVPINEGKVLIYSCGPTVYNYVHIGNLRCYVFNDILRRYLKYKGYEVKQVMNITNVDDKTIRDSQAEGISLGEFTQKYTDAFLEDLDILKIERAEEMPKATDFVPEMVNLVKKLVEKGLAYEKNGTYYFSIAKFDGYGRLANLDPEALKENAEGRLNDTDEYEKENARDFALWKAWDENDGDVFWETDIGKGRPGWHIECSAMSTKFLGETFDIHTGGEDLIFPHHENEIAQSCGASDGEFVKYWLHNAYLIVNGEKMSKSAGNFFTLRDLLDKGYDPMAIRYQLLATHYRQQLNFTEDGVGQAKNTLQRFYDFLDSIDEVSEGEDNATVASLIEKAKQGFEEAMDNDLNISGGLAALFDFMTEVNKLIADKMMSKNDATAVKDAMNGFDSVLGVMEHEKGEIDSEIEGLIKQRNDARDNKDFATSDRIRDDLLARGIRLDDTPEGTKWKRIKK